MTTDDFNTYDWYENERNEENTKDTKQLKIYHIGVYSKLTGKRMLLFKVHASDYADAIETIKGSKYGDLIFSDDDIEIREISEKKYQEMTNKRLYEKIMRKIANSVKRILNEEIQKFDTTDYADDEVEPVDYATVKGLCKDEEERQEWQPKVNKLIRALDKLEAIEDVKGTKRYIGKEMGQLGFIRKIYIKGKMKENNEFQKQLYKILKLLEANFKKLKPGDEETKCWISIDTYPDYSRRGEHIWQFHFINPVKHELISIDNFPTRYNGYNGDNWYSGIQFRDDYGENWYRIDRGLYQYEFPMSCWDQLVEKLT